MKNLEKLEYQYAINNQVEQDIKQGLSIKESESLKKFLKDSGISSKIRLIRFYER